MAGEVEEDVYVPGQPVRVRSRFSVWFDHFFQYDRASYVLSFILSVGLGWWADNWFALLIWLLPFLVVLKVKRRELRQGETIIVETRVQDHRIRHCSYYRKKVIDVPNSGQSIWVLPNARLKDVVKYGDITPAIPTTNIWNVDFFDDNPIDPVSGNQTGELVAVFPQDANFGNMLLTARANQELIDAMTAIGKVRKENDDLKEVAVELYHRDINGGKSEKEALERLQGLLADVEVVEQKLSGTAAANRNAVLFYKNTIPELRKQFEVMMQKFPEKVMAQASELFHMGLKYPMTQEMRDRINSIMSDQDPWDFDEYVRKSTDKKVDSQPTRVGAEEEGLVVR